MCENLRHDPKLVSELNFIFSLLYFRLITNYVIKSMKDLYIKLSCFTYVPEVEKN